MLVDRVIFIIIVVIALLTYYRVDQLQARVTALEQHAVLPCGLKEIRLVKFPAQVFSPAAASINGLACEALQGEVRVPG